MPYLQELLQQQMNTPPVGTDLGLPRGGAYSSYYPSYETQTPQYNVPNAITLYQVGYRTNELLYSLIGKRARAKSEAPLQFWDLRGEHPEEMPNHPFKKLLRKGVNQFIDELTFHMITSIYMDISGFCAWEIETNKMGDIIRLWPMRPEWCSFMRGEQKPLRVIRYQPFGLPPSDIPIERVLFFGNFDPFMPGVRFLSPTAVAMKELGVDNSMTDFLTDFVKHGAKFSGLLSVAQTIDQSTADDYKRRFREAHGGTQNWSDPLVLGLGAKYESMQMNFKDMAFPELDARTESRMCQIFDVPPILVGAKIGLDRSTFSNYGEARKAWIEESISSEWRKMESAISLQIMPFYHEDSEEYECKFDLDNVRSLQEDRTAQVSRAVLMWEKKLVTRNVALEEMGEDPLDDELGSEYFQSQAPVTEPPKPEEKEKEEPETPKGKTQAEQDLEDEETKNFRAFAKRRIKENKTSDIPEFEFKYVPEDKAAELVKQYLVFDTGADKVLEGIKTALLALDKEQPKQPINIQVHSYPGEPPTVNIENKAGDITTPTPVVTVVNKVDSPKVEVQAPAPRKAKRAKLVKADDGSITITEE